MRSMRLALTPAADLLKTAAQRQRMPPDQTALDTFLREKPGQAAALSGFVSHLRRTRSAELTIPNRSARERDRARRNKLRPEMLALMQEADNTRPINIAPVPRSHPAYRYMRDSDGDGVVCE